MNFVKYFFTSLIWSCGFISALFCYYEFSWSVFECYTNFIFLWSNLLVHDIDFVWLINLCVLIFCSGSFLIHTYWSVFSWMSGRDPVQILSSLCVQFFPFLYSCILLLCSSPWILSSISSTQSFCHAPLGLTLLSLYPESELEEL